MTLQAHVAETPLAERASDLVVAVHRRIDDITAVLAGMAGHAHTPFQSHAWARAWIDHTLRTREAAAPFVLSMSTGDGTPLAAVPLEWTRRAGLQVARTLAPRHGPVGPAIFASDDRLIDGGGWKALARQTRRLVPGCHALLMYDVAAGDAERLANRPGVRVVRREQTNAFDLTAGFATFHDRAFSAHQRREHARLLRRLGETCVGRPELRILEESETRRAFITWLIAAKHRWMRATGRAGPLLEKGVSDFYLRLNDRLMADDRDDLVLAGLFDGQRPLAGNMGIRRGNRFYGLVMADAGGAAKKHAANRLLMIDLMAWLGQSGVTVIDVGKGADVLGPTRPDFTAPLADLAIPLTVAGRALCQGERIYAGARAFAKASPPLSVTYHGWRRMRGLRLSG